MPRSDFHERREARIERYEARAAKAQTEADEIAREATT